MRTGPLRGRVGRCLFRARPAADPVSHNRDLSTATSGYCVDLQEHIADAQRRALSVGDDNLDLLHIGMIAGALDRRHLNLLSAGAR
jgi:hypothetical protein